MRSSALLPLTAIAIVATACGSERIQQPARSVPQRDLTLVSQTAEVKVASPVETQRIRPQLKATLHSPTAARMALQRLSPSQPKPKLADEWVPAPVLAAPQPVVQPATTAPTPANDRELLPGKTVSVIPASSGPPTDTDGTDQLPATQGNTRVAHGGGRCGGRGRGPGPSAAPRPDFR
jgi:hypothetical protein